MDIKITKDNYGRLFAVEGVVAMFQFGYQADRDEWLFWMPGRGAYDPTIIKGKDFPLEYFTNACRAVHFLREDGGLDEVVNIFNYKLVKRK